MLDPDVVLRSDGGARGPAPRACSAARGRWPRGRSPSRGSRPFVRPALVNGAAGVVVAPHGRPFSVMGFTVGGGKIVEIDALADPERLRRLDLTLLPVEESSA